MGAGSEAGGALMALLAEAARRRASHLHLLPQPDAVAVLMRIHGALVEQQRLRGEEATLLLVAAGDHGGAARDAATGRLVFRIDAQPAPDQHLAQLGMPPGVRRALHTALAARSGLLLFAGLAGSGLTTTLRHAAGHIGDGTRAVIEAPASGGRGAATLRALLLLDADVLVIDGLEDAAATEVAVEAALDGRLVLASIRSPDAVAAIGALRRMRIAPFHIASVLRLVIGQRLAPRLCRDCAESVQGDRSTTALLGFEPGTILHRPRGCACCAGSGYRGVTALFEAVAVDDPIRLLIDRGGDEAVIASHAFRESRNLASTARTLALEGTIAAEQAVLISRGSAHHGLAADHPECAR